MALLQGAVCSFLPPPPPPLHSKAYGLPKLDSLEKRGHGTLREVQKGSSRLAGSGRLLGRRVILGN